MQKQTAIVLTGGMLDTMNAKTCHGLLRGTERFEVLAVIDEKHAGQDAGSVMDGKALGIPIYKNVQEYIQAGKPIPKYYVIGVALEGGILPAEFRVELLEGVKHGMSIVNGLHSLLSEDEEFIKYANHHQAELIDIRKPRKFDELHFWTGKIKEITTPRIAVLGMDCAVGKRTTCRFLLETCLANGVKAEMIYTGQTGWMQGYKHGFIFDSTLNDFISGEIERAIIACDEQENPDLILIEGQSSLRNPSGPCGSEILLSGEVKYVILQHKPSRIFFDDHESWGALPTLEKEIELIKCYGAEVVAVGLNSIGINPNELVSYQHKMEQTLSIPVIRPLEEGMERILPLVKALI